METEYDPNAPENSQKSADTYFAEAAADIADGEQRPYLGDEATVEQILRTAVDDVLAKMRPEVTPADRLKAIVETAKRTGIVLLGLDDAYAAVRKWNAPGGIDAHLAKWLGLGDKGPVERMQHAMVKLFEEVINLAEYAGQPGVTDDKWQFQLDGLIEQYTGLCLGMTPGMMMAAGTA